MQRFNYWEWGEQVQLQDTAVWTSLSTGEVLLRTDKGHHHFMSWSKDQRKHGPYLDKFMERAVNEGYQALDKK